MGKLLFWLLTFTICLVAIAMVTYTPIERFMNGQMIIKGGKGPIVIDMGYGTDTVTGSPARAKRTT